MSITRVVTVHCDECNQWTDGGTFSQTAREARRVARVVGWRCDKTGDWCPEHAVRKVART